MTYQEFLAVRSSDKKNVYVTALAPLLDENIGRELTAAVHAARLDVDRFVDDLGRFHYGRVDDMPVLWASAPVAPPRKA